MKKFFIFIFGILFFSAILFFEKEILFGAALYSNALVAGLKQNQEIAVVSDIPISVEVPLPEFITEEPEIIPKVMIDSKQEQIDDLLEKIDILQRQLVDLQAPVVQEPLAEMVVEPVSQGPPPATPVVISLYPKLLISEVQIGGERDEKHEYVELYNPDFIEVDLTDWYLQRKTKAAADFSTFVPVNLFMGKKITGHGYFLIARRGSAASPLADILIDHALTDDNTLVLKNPGGEMVDKLGWGAAEDKDGLPAPNPWPGQSIGRSKDEQDSDNNVADFVANILSPRAENVAYVGSSPILAVVESGGSGGGTPLVQAETPAPVVALLSVLISQVQTEGQTVKDEFIKLYNPNEIAVNLAGFSLKKKTSSGTESNLVSSGAFTGEIAAQGYFLIAPQPNDDGTENYTGSVIPDLRYSGKTFSIANTNTILLYDNAGLLVSEFLASPTPVSEPEPAPAPELPAEPEIPPVEPEEPPVDVPPEAPPVSQPSVIINEIAWMGTSVSANDEWMELFNPGDLDVNLAGWKLQAADGTPTITLSGTISARGFYLLERTNDDSVPGVAANQIYTGALGNGGENLSLADAAGVVVDQVNAVPWPTGNNTTKQTMQRANASAWQTSEVPGGTPGL